MATVLAGTSFAAEPWDQEPIWHDGLVEKATYDAEMVIYGQPRQYEAVAFTNKEQHELATHTKAGDGSTQTQEVWKHNWIEVVPTPNYDYKFVTTSHLAVEGLGLSRFDASSQEFCGTSFKQLLKEGEGWGYFAFSYMPQSGRVSGEISVSDTPLVPFDALPLYLRSFDFDGKGSQNIALVPAQKSNKNVAYKPVAATVSFAGETDAGYKLDLVADGKTLGSYVFAKDRQHVMVSYAGADGLTYTLKQTERTNYWTLKE